MVAAGCSARMRCCEQLLLFRVDIRIQLQVICDMPHVHHCNSLLECTPTSAHSALRRRDALGRRAAFAMGAGACAQLARSASGSCAQQRMCSARLTAVCADLGAVRD